jgi:ABC-type transport system substrate-binding protein
MFAVSIYWLAIGVNLCLDKAPAGVVKLSGTLNVGQKELGPYFGSPKISGNPQIFLNSAALITETLGIHAFEGNKLLPGLAESWEVSPDGQIWTFHIRQGVQFHKGFGEMTAEDVEFSFEQVANSEKNARASIAKEVFFNGNESRSMPDDYTWIVDTGTPFSDVGILELMGMPRSVCAWIVSKKQIVILLPPDPGRLANGKLANTGKCLLLKIIGGKHPISQR